MEEREGIVRVRLDVAYDGTGFAGWAKQAQGERTVQGVLEEALALATRRSDGDPPRLVVAGRTDAGVHATGQVAHVDLTEAQVAALTRRDADAGVEAIARRLTGMAGEPRDLVVRRASVAPAGFDARFSAAFRRYRYRIADRPTARDPLERHRTLDVPRPLDDERIRAASTGLIGLHDFGAYCKPRSGATTIRHLRSMAWSREADGVLVADVQADAFCHSMVRALVGASLAVGAGRIAPDRLAALLDEPVRSNEFALAPAHGLTLVEVGYPPDAELAAQAAQSRARRSLQHQPFLEGSIRARRTPARPLSGGSAGIG